MRSSSFLVFSFMFAACGAPGAPQSTGASPAAPAVAPVVPVASSAPAAPPPPAPATPAVATPTPPPSATAQSAPPPSRCPAGMTFVPGGEFKPAWYPKNVRVADLCVNTTETTAAEYAECAKLGGCTTTKLDCAAQATFNKPDVQDHPMVCVDAAQANAYCTFRHQRLPTAGEWEWAARGGAEGRPYPWGDGAPSDQLCWAGKQKQTGTCKVGSFPAGNTAQGIADMSGNVLEFTTTENDSRSEVRIARGGSWRDGIPELVKNARVGSFGVTYRCGFLGIRCVQEPASGQ